MSEESSSIGAIWPPQRASNNRLRGFYNEVVESSTEINSFATQFEHYRQEAVNHPEVDRLSIRAIASIGAISTLEYLGVSIEAGMPLRDETDLFVVYTGWNAPDRTAGEEMLLAHRALISTASQREHRGEDSLARLNAQGFKPKIIDHKTPQDRKVNMVDRFTTLYSAFGYEREEVQQLLLSPSNTIAYIEDPDGVVSTAMAEKVTIPVEGYGDIRMAEITEAFTMPTHRRMGLYESISGYLTERLVMDERDRLDVVYGESNLTMPGVVIAAHQNRRRFSYLDRDRLCVRQPNFGILPQNFRIEDGEETRPYNDFALSYVTFES